MMTKPPYKLEKMRFGEDDIGRLQQREGSIETVKPAKTVRLSRYFPVYTRADDGKKPSAGRINEEQN